MEPEEKTEEPEQLVTAKYLRWCAKWTTCQTCRIDFLYDDFGSDPRLGFSRTCPSCARTMVRS